jgi:hypothetical protein
MADDFAIDPVFPNADPIGSVTTDTTSDSSVFNKPMQELVGQQDAVEISVPPPNNPAPSDSLSSGGSGLFNLLGVAESQTLTSFADPVIPIGNGDPLASLGTGNDQANILSLTGSNALDSLLASSGVAPDAGLTSTVGTGTNTNVPADPLASLGTGNDQANILSLTGSNALDSLLASSGIAPDAGLTSTVGTGTNTNVPADPLASLGTGNDQANILSLTGSNALDSLLSSSGITAPNPLLSTGTISDIQASADPNGAANRAASTAELVAAQANGATKFTDEELSRLNDAGVDLREMGKSDGVIASLPKNVPEPTDAQLGKERAAVKNFLDAAGGEVENLANANVDPATRGVIAPFVSSKDVTQAGADRTTLASVEGGMSWSGNALLPVEAPRLPLGNALANRGDTGDNPLWDKIDNEAAERARATAPALERVEDVIRKSAYGKDSSRYGGSDRASARTVVVPSADASARFRRFSDAESPGGVNKTGAGNIWISPGLVTAGSKPEVAALAIVHERTHAEQAAKNPTRPLSQKGSIQEEVQGFEQQLKLYKELRPKLINADGAPVKGLNPEEKQLVEDTEQLYRLQKSGGSAAIKKEIETWDAYQSVPGRSDRIYLPGGIVVPIPKLNKPDYVPISPEALPLF